MKPQIPWLRVFVEGVVIVGSILLAFGIDAAWTERQERVVTIALLEALSDEIQGAMGEMRVAQERRERRIEVIHDFLAAITGAVPAPPTDTLEVWLGTLWGSSSPRRSLASLDNLRLSGTLATVESEELLRALSRYVRTLAAGNAVTQRVIDLWEDDLRPYLIANTDALPQFMAVGRSGLASDAYRPAFQSDLDHLLRDRSFQNLLLARLNRTESAQSVNGDILTLLEEIADLIEAELR